MKLLHLEDWSDATNVFIQELHAGTGCTVEHAASVEEGLLKIMHGHGSVDIALYTVGSAEPDPLSFPDRVRAATAEASIRCPQFVLLASPSLPLPCAAKCIDRQVVYLLRDYPKQIVASVKAMLWKIRTAKLGPTIRVEFYGGHYRFFLCGRTSEEEIRVSKQIGRLLLLLLRSTSTVDLLAEKLCISRVSVKKYMRQLRLTLDATVERMPGIPPIATIVWMERGQGGTLCGLRANPVWG